MQKVEFGAGIFTVKNFLSSPECISYIQMSENIGFEEAAIQTKEGPEILKAVRNNDRIIFDDVDLATFLFERAKQFLPDSIDDWRLSGLNERFRFYRYTPEQYFKWHKDGFYCRSNTEVSQLSLLLYLNGEYEGGETEFRWDVIKPEAGMALVFPHLMMHQGAPLISGTKYVLRTDVMYQRQA
nr:2OG-Fe(II) oxygenase [uncultured Pseudomonas sp.]